MEFRKNVHVACQRNAATQGIYGTVLAETRGSLDQGQRRKRIMFSFLTD